MNVTVLLAELERAEAFGENPGATRLWLSAPWGLRRRYADGYITAEDFWQGLRQWLEFEGRRAA